MLPGSPPLTRELLLFNALNLFCHGITPAYAGTTQHEATEITAQEDHPRLRGNYYKHDLEVIEKEGSPPLTRELRIRCCSIPHFDRITPAYAGTTLTYRKNDLVI